MRQQDLEQLRKEVDGLNVKILDLINERTSLVKQIGKVKEKQGVNRFDPLRERHMLDLIKEHNKGPLSQGTVNHLFKEIFKTALKLLRSISIILLTKHLVNLRKFVSVITIRS